MSDMEEIDCPNCSGFWTSGEVTCPRCAGAGHLRWPDDPDRCAQCQGTGKITCSQCGGSGKIYRESRTVLDDDCDEEYVSTPKPPTTPDQGKRVSSGYSFLSFVGLVALALLAIGILTHIPSTSLFTSGPQVMTQPQATQPEMPIPHPQRPLQPQRPVPQSRFAPVVSNQNPSPNPPPVFAGRHPTNGDFLYNWGGRQWIIPQNNRPYRYLCVVNGGLNVCWPNPPNQAAVPCRSNDVPGWCWNE